MYLIYIHSLFSDTAHAKMQYVSIFNIQHQRALKSSN